MAGNSDSLHSYDSSPGWPPGGGYYDTTNGLGRSNSGRRPSNSEELEATTALLSAIEGTRDNIEGCRETYQHVVELLDELQRAREVAAREISRQKEQLEKERREVEGEKKKLEAAIDLQELESDGAGDETGGVGPSGKFAAMVRVQVGSSKEFKTSVRSLKRHPRSLLAKLLEKAPEGRSRVEKIFIDRDETHFPLILNYLRYEDPMNELWLDHLNLRSLHEIEIEARYYRLPGLLTMVLWKRIEKTSQSVTFEKILQSQHEGRYLYAKSNYTEQQSHDESKQPSTSAADGAANGGHSEQQQHEQDQEKPSTSSVYATTADYTYKFYNMKRICFDSVCFGYCMTFDTCVLQGAVFKRCSFEGRVRFKNCDLMNMSFQQCKGLPNSFNDFCNQFCEDCRVNEQE